MQGGLDFPLTDLGIEQARHCAASFKGHGPALLVSSPLQRARQTAQEIAAVTGFELLLDNRIAEYEVGQVAGLTGPEIRERFPEIAASWSRGERPVFPGEEGRQHFRERVGAFMDEYINCGQPVIAVAHGGVVAEVCAQVLGLELSRPGIFRAENCSITEIGTDRAGRKVLMRQNDTCHLDGLRSQQPVATPWSRTLN